MKRRSFLGALLAAPVAIPAAIKVAEATEPPVATGDPEIEEMFSIKRVGGVPTISISGNLVLDRPIVAIRIYPLDHPALQRPS